MLRALTVNVYATELVSPVTVTCRAVAPDEFTSDPAAATVLVVAGCADPPMYGVTV